MTTCSAVCPCCWIAHDGAVLEDMQEDYQDSRAYRALCEECVTQSCSACQMCHLELGINKRVFSTPVYMATGEEGDEPYYIYGFSVVHVSQPIAGWITAGLGQLAQDEVRRTSSPYGETSCSTKIPDDPDLQDACEAALAGTANQEQWEAVYTLILNSPECLALAV